MGEYKHKLTIVFTGCSQVGIDTYVDHHKTKVIYFTEKQEEALVEPQGMDISNVIFARHSKSPATPSEAIQYAYGISLR